MTLGLHVTFLVLALTALGIRPAAAQTPGRPYRGLFGGAQPMGSRGQMVDLSMSGFLGWDEPQKVVNPLESADERTKVSGPFSGGSASVDYTHPGKSFSFSASGSAFAGYFPDNNDNPWYDSYAGSADFGWRVDPSARTHLALTGGVRASTDFHLGALLEGVGGSVGSANRQFDNSLAHQPNMTSTSRAELTHDFSARSNASLYYGFGASRSLSGDDGFPEHGTQSVGGRYNHRLTQNLGYHLGYGYGSTVIFGAGEPVPGVHRIDTGIDYGRSLSLTRSTEFAFSVGTAATTTSHTAEGQTSFSSAHFTGVGNVVLMQEIGRSWQLNAYYNRRVSYEPAFIQPGLFDSAGVTLAGLLTRRLDVSTSAQYQVGRIGLEAQNFKTWSASAQIRAAIAHNLAAYATYYYIRQDVAADVALPLGYPRFIDRNGVRAGITAWFPLWHGRGAP